MAFQPQQNSAYYFACHSLIHTKIKTRGNGDAVKGAGKDIDSNLWLSVLPKDTLTSEREKLGIEH